jgi:aryl-alcohol dehydrogenase-like predicted oxidoreductase
MKRRPFLQLVGAAAGTGVFGFQTAIGNDLPIVSKTKGMPYRVLGRTGLKVSIVGYPGLALAQGTQEEGTESLKKALDAGVNYLDNAPAYGNGDCEIKMGIGLEGIDRNSYFLACKTKMRDKQGAREELERSLKRLKTDHFDVYQFHHLHNPADVDTVFGPGGAMETVIEAKKEGKIRFVGFSAHTTKSALLAMKYYAFDTVMFPLNFLEYYKIGFGKEVLDKAQEIGAAVIAIKVQSSGKWPQGVERHRKWWYRTLEEQREIDMAHRFTLSQKGVVMGIPPGWLDLAEKGFQAGHAYQPIAQTELEELNALAEKYDSVFKAMEDSVAYGTPLDQDSQMYPDCCPGSMA